MNDGKIVLLVYFVLMHFCSLENVVALKRAVVCVCSRVRSASESVERASLPLESVDDIHGSDRLPFGMFSVGHGISDDVLKEDLEHTTSLFIDEARDTLDTPTTGQPPDRRLRNPLDVVS